MGAVPSQRREADGRLVPAFRAASVGRVPLQVRTLRKRHSGSIHGYSGEAAWPHAVRITFPHSALCSLHTRRQGARNNEVPHPHGARHLGEKGVKGRRKGRGGRVGSEAGRSNREGGWLASGKPKIKRRRPHWRTTHDTPWQGFCQYFARTLHYISVHGRHLDNQARVDFAGGFFVGDARDARYAGRSARGKTSVPRPDPPQ